MPRRPRTTHLVIDHPLSREHLATAATEEPAPIETAAPLTIAQFVLGAALRWIAAPRKSGPKSAKKREKIKRKIKELGPAHPGDLTREQWIETLGTNAGTYDRAWREVRSEQHQN